MKFKKKIALLFALFFALVIQANAQLCGKYETALMIKTADEKPVTNAEIQLVPLEDDETRGKRFVRDEADLSKFSLAFNEGHQIKTRYKLIVSAAGFKGFEKEIKFPHCARRSFIITLADSDSGAESGLEEIRKIRFWTNNSQGKAVGEVKVSVIRADGKREEKLSNENGGADFEIFNNKKYTFRFEKDGYKTKEIEISYTDNSAEYNTVELERETTAFSGNVYDDYGAVIVKSQVLIRGKDNFEKIVFTNDAGVFEIDLSAGNYSIEVSSAGFQTFKIEKYRIAPAYKGKLNLDIVLEVGPGDDGHRFEVETVKTNKKPN